MSDSITYNTNRVSNADIVDLVKDFQSSIGLEVDGRFGPDTKLALDQVTILSKATPEKTRHVGNFRVHLLKDGSFDVSVSTERKLR